MFSLVGGIEIYKESMKPGVGSLEKTNKLDKPLAKLTRGHRDRIQISKITKEKGDITTDTEEIKKSQMLLQKPILNKLEKCRGNGQFARQIPGTKVKSISDK